MAPQGYVNVSLKPEASDALTTMTAQITGILGRRVSHTDALLIVAQIMETQGSELAQEVRLAAFELNLT